jgi:hypothetical protein
MRFALCDESSHISHTSRAINYDLIDNRETTCEVEPIFHQSFEAKAARPQQFPLVHEEVKADIQASNQHHITKIRG